MSIQETPVQFGAAHGFRSQQRVDTDAMHFALDWTVAGGEHSQCTHDYADTAADEPQWYQEMLLTALCFYAETTPELWVLINAIRDEIETRHRAATASFES